MSTTECVLIMAAILALIIWAGVREGQRQRRVREANEARLQAIGTIVARIDQTIVLFSGPPRLAIRQPFTVNGQVLPAEKAATRHPAEYEVFPVTPQLTVSAETTGNFTPTSASSTSVAVGGLSFGETAINNADKREIFLAFVSDTWSHVERFGPVQQLDARKFAAQTMQVVKGMGGQSS